MKVTSLQANRLKSVSEWMGLTMSELTPEVKGYLQNLAATAVALDLGECTDSRYVCVMAETTECYLCRFQVHVGVHHMHSYMLVFHMTFCSSANSLCLSLSELCCQRARNEVSRKKMIKERNALQDSLRLSLLKQANQKRYLFIFVIGASFVPVVVVLV